ncbi:MAG: NADH:flavin oxidoreductase [Bacteroidales bacterium]|nr:NADH:flavin oxidoreductase [Bacteroidales bacterium]MBQ3522819.1 NADH:flavin oxidoreductase [Bacteroidales bacterium]
MESILFTPGKLGPLTIRNRTIRSAAFENMATGNNPSAMLLDYHRSVAAGGVGMTTLAYASIAQSGLSFEDQLWLRPEVVPGLREITDAIHKEGAAASIQIGHCGNMSHRAITKCMPVSASNGFNLYSPTLHRKLSEKEMIEMAKDFGNGVRLAREAGFDCVEVHAGHGYLISQFLSPYTNRRRDQYGGPLKNRMKFMQMCMSEVMEAAKGDMAIVAKTNMRDGFKGGNDIEEGVEIAKELKNLGVHGLVLSGGFVSKAPMYVMRGAMPIKSMTHYMKIWWLKYGVKMAGSIMVPTVPFKEAYFLEDALVFRKEIPDLPLIYVGGLVARDKIDEVLGKGFEFVQMGRALLNNPSFVNDMKQGCQRCNCKHSNYCIGRMYSKEMACHQHLKEELPEKLKKEIEELEKRWEKG